MGKGKKWGKKEKTSQNIKKGKIFQNLKIKEKRGKRQLGGSYNFPPRV